MQASRALHISKDNEQAKITRSEPEAENTATSRIDQKLKDAEVENKLAVAQTNNEGSKNKDDEAEIMEENDVRRSSNTSQKAATSVVTATRAPQQKRNSGTRIVKHLIKTAAHDVKRMSSVVYSLKSSISSAPGVDVRSDPLKVDSNLPQQLKEAIDDTDKGGPSRRRKRFKTLKTKQHNDRTVHRAPPSTELVDAVTHVEQQERMKPILQQEAQTWEQRAMAARERREKLQQERVENVLATSWTLRQDKVQERAMQRKRVQQWIVYTVVASRFHIVQERIDAYRIGQRKLLVEYRSATIIIKVMRRHYVVSYRRRILKALNTVSCMLLRKIVQWKRQRRRHACSVIVAFLNALEYENSITHGCLSMMAKGKKWISYKHKVVKLQRIWRREILHINAQVQLLDKEWQREQERTLTIEVDKLHKMGELGIETETKMIQAANRTRKAMNMKLLPTRKPESRDRIRKRLIEEMGSDILTTSGIAVVEIRVGILREALRRTKRMYAIDLEKYLVHQKELKSRRQAVSAASMTIGFAFRHVSTAAATGDNARCTSHQETTAPNQPLAISNNRTPKFSMIFGPKALDRIIELGEVYVNKVRHAWSPEVMEFVVPVYSDIGKEIAQIHYKELNGE